MILGINLFLIRGNIQSLRGGLILSPIEHPIQIHSHLDLVVTHVYRILYFFRVRGQWYLHFFHLLLIARVHHCLIGIHRDIRSGRRYRILNLGKISRAQFHVCYIQLLVPKYVVLFIERVTCYNWQSRGGPYIIAFRGIVFNLMFSLRVDRRWRSPW